MSTKNPPAIPPRPSRSPNNLAASNASGVPKIPPRPSNRVGRPTSPQKDRFAPSPLNEPPTPSGSTPASQQGSSGIGSPARPESVTMPSVGQEGMEYENITSQVGNDGKVDQPAETRNIREDLHLHAPRPSLPASSATAKVQAVTRTDPHTATDSESPENTHRPTRHTTGTPRSQQDSSTDRRKSFQHGDEQGIPEIGQRVPMYPNAGDVQAPSPSPRPEARRDGDSQHHSRNRSTRETSLPPGSYGLHGHGVQFNDPLEKAWYDKHPKELAREEDNNYGPSSPRPEGSMSCEKLNEIVKTSGIKGTGLDMSTEAIGPPDEEIGNIATEELASRFSSPLPSSPLRREKSQTSQPSIESPPKGENIPPQTEIPEGEDQEVEIHINEPLHHQHHPDGFAPGPELTKPSEADAEVTEERVNDVPVLASDEIEPEAVHMEPAVSPPLEQQKSGQHKSRSRPTSASRDRRRSGRSPSPSFSRLASPAETEEAKHSPPKNIVEHEPLFPDDNGEKPQQVKSPPQQQRFPSKDIWEDAPSSAQLQATVTTPDIPRRPKSKEAASSLFEPPEKEAERTDQASQLTPESGVEETPSSLEGQKSQEHDPKQRFPSNDIWEEAPESQQLTATVQSPEVPVAKPASPEKPTSPELPRKPSTPGIPVRPSRRPQRTSSPEKASEKSPEKSAPRPIAQAQPTSPATEMKKPPTIPDRPKPQVPTRPSRPIKRDSEEGSRASSDSSGPPVTKPKPVIPSRPGGSKIAALKAGFLSDLNNQLKLGPQAPKPKEKQEPEQPAERVPLSDARKGRARGPQRRKPAKPVLPEASEQKPIEKSVGPVKVTITEPWSVWSIDSSGIVTIAGQTNIDKSPDIKDFSVDGPAKVDTSPVAKDAVAEVSPNIDAPRTVPDTAGGVEGTPVESSTRTETSPDLVSAESPKQVDAKSPESTVLDGPEKEINRQTSDSNTSPDSNPNSSANDEPENHESIVTEIQRVQSSHDEHQQSLKMDPNSSISSPVTAEGETLAESKPEPVALTSPTEQQPEPQEPGKKGIDPPQTEIKEEPTSSSETKSPDLSKSTES